ncbi:MAG TPA: right-handed parallel beta-helix repeat-containing protein, partial [Chitinophagaceae bacterium]|nr:right-handed parallel beta-helix repeat-containing protein [Chitinophagaceae bacterium]
HYDAMGITLPFTKQAADSIRSKASRSTLTALRAAHAHPQKEKPIPAPSSTGYIAGAGTTTGMSMKPPQDAIMLSPGQPLQQALDQAAAGSKWVVLAAGVYTLPHTLRLPSGITVMGSGISTVLFLDPVSGEREAIINAADDMHDITLANFVIEASPRTDPGTDPNGSRSYRGGYNRAGILFRCAEGNSMKRIQLTHLTIRNATYSGVSISGANDIVIERCDFSENGANVPPGPGLLHNLLLSHCNAVKVNGSRLVTSPTGGGIAADYCSKLSINDCEIARNGGNGILLAESNDITISNNLLEANDNSAILAEFLFNGNSNITVTNNRIQYNNGIGLESYGTRQVMSSNNRYEGNRLVQEKILATKQVLMKP